MPTLPAAFLGHGNPMNTLEHNRFTAAWTELGQTMERPSAIHAISAHWYVNISAVTAMAHPRTIHDFYGFPDELFAFEYPAPGDPALAQRVVDLAGAADLYVGLDADSWGLDHGTWSVLAHVFPDASIPVVQLSVDGTKSIPEHLNLAASLAPLRDEGVFIVASGNSVHNLGMIEWGAAGRGTDWAEDFDRATTELMTASPGDIGSLTSHPAWQRAVPTPDHFLPLVYLAGLCDQAGTTARTLVDGCDLGSLSMTSYVTV